MNQPDPNSLLSKDTVLQRLRIGEKALRRLIREGQLRVVKFGKTSPLKFRQLDVARLIEASTLTAGYTKPPIVL
jgi:hypothetical protein